ncbi:hypothetical protein LCGC14_0428990 [marine sediment metagenome]|uniref:NTP pyrophosphohydrolase MazG-like domain-containing protein n=1 Tax=marine sediment metagenome TaxID=412755 RepID=A0A0F9VAN7_9ZZZZ
MNPTEYQKLAGRTECNQRDARVRMDTFSLTSIRLNHAALGLTGEVGELCSAIEKWIYYGQGLDRINLIEELGDCLWYIALTCNVIGVDLGSVMEANISKLCKWYPEKYTDRQAAEENRDRQAERKQLEEFREEMH